MHIALKNVCISWLKKPNSIHILSKLIQFSVDFTFTGLSSVRFFPFLVQSESIYECVAPSVFNTIVANNPISSDEFSLGNSFSLLHKFAKCAVSTLIKHDSHYLVYAYIHHARIGFASSKCRLVQQYEPTKNWCQQNDPHFRFSTTYIETQLFTMLLIFFFFSPSNNFSFAWHSIRSIAMIEKDVPIRVKLNFGCRFVSIPYVVVMLQCLLIGWFVPLSLSVWICLIVCVYVYVDVTFLVASGN